MYKIQLINTYNQEILREAVKSEVEIERTVKDFQECSDNGGHTVIFCNNRKTWNAEFLFHHIVYEKRQTVYKLFFLVNLAHVQAVVKK
ncbi:MAG: hypothetical protein ACQEV7_04635 [Bacillota bacterium]